MTFLSKLNVNPFAGQTPGVQFPPLPATPISEPKNVPTSLIGATNPFNKAAFAGIPKDLTKNGLSFLQAEPGLLGLGDRAIQLGENKTLGKNLFISI